MNLWTVKVTATVDGTRESLSLRVDANTRREAGDAALALLRSWGAGSIQIDRVFNNGWAFAR